MQELCAFCTIKRHTPAKFGEYLNHLLNFLLIRLPHAKSAKCSFCKNGANSILAKYMH